MNKSGKTIRNVLSNLQESNKKNIQVKETFKPEHNIIKFNITLLIVNIRIKNEKPKSLNQHINKIKI